jgi:hypothetical protein
MSLAVVAGSTNALQVLPFCPLRIVDPNERNYVVYVISSRIVAHLAHRVGLSLQQANTFPLATITPALLRPSKLLTFLASLTASERLW